MLEVIGCEPVLERRAALRAGEEELVVYRAHAHRHPRRAALEIGNLTLEIRPDLGIEIGNLALEIGLEIGLEQPVQHVLSAQLGAPWLG